MRTELTEKIIGWVKGALNLNPESTEAEIHEATLSASDDLKADLIVNVANQIANFAMDEINKRVEAFSEQLKADTESTIEQLNAKLSLIETKLSEVQQPQGFIQMADVESIATKLREEFGNSLNEIKAATGQKIDGDGTIIQKASTGKTEAPKAAPWKISF